MNIFHHLQEHSFVKMCLDNKKNKEKGQVEYKGNVPTTKVLKVLCSSSNTPSSQTIQRQRALRQKPSSTTGFEIINLASLHSMPSTPRTHRQQFP